MGRQELCHIPIVPDIFAQALAVGDGKKAKEVCERFIRWQVEVCVGIFGSWATKYIEWVDRQKGREAMVALLAPEPLVRLALLSEFDAEIISVAEDILDGDGRKQEEVFLSINDGDAAAAYRAFLRVYKALRKTFELRRDWVTLLGSEIYGRWGIDDLEASMRFVWDTGGWWPPAMKADLAKPPDERVRYWAELDTFGFFSTISITEDDDKIVVNRICGSCGRQQRDGRYEAPWNFALVKEVHPITWLQGDMPVYRAHIAAVHGIFPIVDTGIPWPAVSCSKDKGATCRYTFYKKPEQAPKNYFDAVGRGDLYRGPRETS